MVVYSPLIRPYFLGVGGIGGVPLGSHDSCSHWVQPFKGWNFGILNGRKFRGMDFFKKCFSGDGGCGFLRLFWCIGILDTSVDPKNGWQNVFEWHLIWCSTNHSISPYFSKIDKSLYQHFFWVVLVQTEYGNSIPTNQNRFTCFLEMQQWGFYCARAPCQRRSVTCHVRPNAGRLATFW